MADESCKNVTELMRESARYVLANDDGFYTRREVWDARRFLAQTEPLPDAWKGKLPEQAETPPVMDSLFDVQETIQR